MRGAAAPPLRIGLPSFIAGAWGQQPFFAGDVQERADRAGGDAHVLGDLLVRLSFPAHLGGVFASLTCSCLELVSWFSHQPDDGAGGCAELFGEFAGGAVAAHRMFSSHGQPPEAP